MTYLERAQNLYSTMDSDIYAALDEFYADDVVVVEANGEEFQGKETQRKRIQEWQESIESFHGGGGYSITSNEDEGVTMVESWGDATFKGSGRMKFEEVGVQHWEDGKIVRERFYYNMPGQ